MQKKKLIIGLALALIIGSSILLAQSMGKILRHGIQAYGPRVTGSEIRVEDVHASVWHSSSITNLLIANPRGFQGPFIFKVAKVEMSINPLSLLSDTIIIHRLRIVDPEIAYEMGMHGSNLSTLGLILAKKPKEGASGVGEQKVIIEHLDIEGGSIHPSIMSEKLQSLRVPEVHVDDLGQKDKTLTYAEAGAEVMNALAKSLSQVDFQGFVKKSALDMLQEGKKNVDNTINQNAEGVKDEAGIHSVDQGLSTAERAVDQGVKGVTNKLKDMLGQ